MNYFHSIVGYQNPCPTGLPYNALEGIKRILAYSATNQSPVTVSQQHKMNNYFRSKKSSLSNLLTILACVLSFMGFLWFSEVVKSRLCDIIINKTLVSIFIENSKTDVYWKGSWFYLIKLDTAICRIELVSQYF